VESKSKIFTKKLISLVLAVIMAASCFTGAITAFAADSDAKNYNDDNLFANFMAWAETTDDQTAEALFDYADMYLGDLMTGLLGSSEIKFSYSILGNTIGIDGYLDSIDGVYDLIRQADDLLDSYGSLVAGDIKNIDLSPIGDLKPSSTEGVVSGCGVSYRSVYSAKELLQKLAQTLYINSHDFGSAKNVLGQFFKGTLSLGRIESLANINVYSLLQDTLGCWDGYESNLVYNIVCALIWNNTDWYTDEEIEAFKADSSKWNFDEQLFGKLSSEFLDSVAFTITYPTTIEVTNSKGETEYVKDSSSHRWEEISAKMESGLTYEQAAKACGYDPDLKYEMNDDGTSTGKILLFQYGDEKLEVTKSDSLFNVAFKGLEIAWKTALEPSLGLVQANYDVDRGHGANFDNAYYKWAVKNGGWNTDDWTSNYAASKVEAWADAVYKTYSCSSAKEFLANVKETFEYDRSVVDDANNNWSDIDPTTLFNKLRYNPLADLYFDMQTGPINLYFVETGISNISAFFDTAFDNYDNMVSGFNDALVAATKDIFIDSTNVGYTNADGSFTNLSVPLMSKTGNITLDSKAPATIAKTLVSNVLAMIEYVANTTDANILNPFYTTNSISTLSNNLTQQNIEEAMVPMLIACLQEVSLTDPIHDSKWDMCVDVEGVAYVALEEYLSNVLPNKDYSQLVQVVDGKLVAGTIDISGDGKYTLFDDAILPMARDAVGYLLNSIVPCRDKNGNEWDVYESDVTTDKTTLLELLNSVICYYASNDEFTDTSGAAKNNKTTGRGVASLLGVVNSDGSCKVTMSNTIWENIDAIANQLLPICGELQYGSSSYYGKASAEDIIWNKLVKGIFDIGPNNGATTLIEQVITIVTAPCIKDDGIDLVVYDDFLVPLVNGLFGARYSGQGYGQVIPYSSYYATDGDKGDSNSTDDTDPSTPFDSLLQADTFAYFSSTVTGTKADGWTYTDDGYKTGVLGILICNLAEFFDASSGGEYGKSAPDGVQGAWNGAMFAVTAVNSFIPSFVPQLSDHSLGLATATISNPSQSSLSVNGAFETTNLVVKNNSIGINRFWRDENGTVNQDDRYFMYVYDVEITDEAGNVGPSNIKSTITTDSVVAPQDSFKTTISGTAVEGNNLYTFTVKYCMFEGKTSNGSLPSFDPYSEDDQAKIVADDLEVKAYLYLSTSPSWASVTYPRTDDGVLEFSTAEESVASTGSNIANYKFYYNKYGSYTYVTANGNSSSCQVPTNMIVQLTNPSAVNTYTYRFRSNANGTRSVDGVYTYMSSGTEYYPVTDGVIASSTTTATEDHDTWAYTAIDQTTGNVLNYNLYDYSLDGGKTWDRGTQNTECLQNGYQGYTRSDLNTIYNNLSDAKKENYTERTHVVWTIDEALDTGYVVGVQRTAAAVVNGVQEYVYTGVIIDVTAHGSTYATNLLEGTYSDEGRHSISFGTPTPGLYLTAPKQQVSKYSSSYSSFLAYDGSTELEQDSYTLKVQFFLTANRNMKASINLYIADDTESAGLVTSYNSAIKEMAAYQASDFAQEGQLEADNPYYSLQKSFESSLATMSSPINQDNAMTLSSEYQTVATTSNTTNTLGDLAYAPIASSTALPSKIMVNATKGDNYWYYNSECTMPVYSNVPLNDKTVVTINGKTYDPANTSIEVAKDEDGNYRYVNTPVYETEWSTTDAGVHYLKDTSTQVNWGTESSPKLVYSQMQFVYRDANGDKVNSTDVWSYKLASSTREIKPYDGTDYRSMYEQAADEMEYWMQTCKANVNQAFATTLYNDVTLDRQGQTSVDYYVGSYEKKVQVARDAESLISTSVDSEGNVTATTSSASVEIKNAIDVYNRYKDRVRVRSYEGRAIEAEILCASDNAYTDLTVTKQENENGTTYTISSPKNSDVTYGAYVDGVLTNAGSVVYTEESWNNYVTALANAIEVAKAGVESLAITNNSEKPLTISSTYAAKKNLAVAENNLTPYVEDEVTTITVSGKVTMATNATGTAGATGAVGITVSAGDVSAVTASDGTFTIEVPVGTTELTISGSTTIDRTVTLTGTADIADVVIPVVVCDYNKDGSINAVDKNLFNSSYGLSSNFNIYCDLNADNSVNAVDKNLFNALYSQVVEYSALSLD
jgi:hypothetical protein